MCYKDALKASLPAMTSLAQLTDVMVSAVEGLSDFFGRSDNLVPRQEERFSIVFAFA